MAFRTKLDYSDNRQIKQFEKSHTVLSGGTSFGLTFSALTSGPNLETSGDTETYTTLASTFSGNGTTTIYNWYDPIMAIGEPYLSAITPSLSATTQLIEEPVFSAETTTVIDGNTVALFYTGVTFDITPIAFYDLGGGNYSGTVETLDLTTYSATSLDYTGRTIWVDVSGITRTERLIVTNDPQIGYVLTCYTSEGMAKWEAVTGVTISGGSILWSSGTGTYSIAAKNYNSVASGNYSVSYGYNALASGNYSHTEGNGTIATGETSHAEGSFTKAFGYAAHAEGNNTTAITQGSHAEGDGTTASGTSSHSEGYGTTAGGYASHAEGHFTQALGNYTHSEGGNTTTIGTYSHAGGFNSIASGETSFVHGSGSTAQANYTIVLGNGITGTTANTTYVERLNINTLAVYADNTAAASLEVGTVYRTSTGQLMVRY